MRMGRTLRRSACALTMYILGTAIESGATILAVNAEGTGEYPTIRAAVNAAVDGDEIHLVAGTYTGEDNANINFQGKAITIRSQNLDPKSAIIALGQNKDPMRAFILESGEGPASVLDALTIQGGHTEDYGGIVRCAETSPTIRDCVFAGNHGMAFVHHGAGGPTIEGCQFLSNWELGAVRIRRGLVRQCLFQNNSLNGSFGGALIMGDTVVEDCIFINNNAGLGGGAIDGYGTVRRCSFVESDGGPGTAINVYGGEFIVEGCTFTDNYGIPVVFVESGSLAISNSILAFNFSGITGPVIEGSIASISCTDIFESGGGGWEGDIAQYLGQSGNISVDPLFCDQDAGDYTLYSNSPCAPANSGGCGLIGAYDVGCEPTSVEAKSWGKIKGMYR